jgi:hypothetical protein
MAAQSLLGGDRCSIEIGTAREGNAEVLGRLLKNSLE